ncbi:hypothetical protein GQ600_13991 [Phytophthora cactorum]|nr:hypothetical protein GQ600_13991 [Phytophthora cactorum]
MTMSLWAQAPLVVCSPTD